MPPSTHGYGAGLDENIKMPVGSDKDNHTACRPSKVW